MHMAKVKGSPVYRMKVVPHRPLRDFSVRVLILLLILAAFAGAWRYAEYHVSHDRLTPEEAKALRGQLAGLTDEQAELRKELARYQMSAEVDRQAGEELRKRVLILREEKAALERDVAVYRTMNTSRSANPQGISFGLFTLNALGDNRQKLKLAVQKLAEGETEFTGELSFTLVGQSDGKEARIPLHQVALPGADGSTLAESIPLSFKFFQNLEVDISLPEGFVPKRADLEVKSSGKRNPVKVSAQLEWPESH